MRIISGTAKGRKLKTLKGLDKRPTTDRVKESIFGKLGTKIVGAEALDLFAGTGNLGIEALSRGAKTVLFIDHDTDAKRVIEENLALTHLTDRAEIWRSDVFRALNHFKAEGRTFDVVFADPPYGQGYGEQTLLALERSGVLRDGGLFILEHHSSEKAGSPLKGYYEAAEKTFGQSVVHFFTISHNEGEDHADCSLSWNL